MKTNFYIKGIQVMPFLFLALVAFSCEKSPTLFHIEGRTMGTTYNIKVSTLKEFDKSLIKAEVDNALIKLNKEMSTYDKSSEISRFNQLELATPYKISPDFFKVTKYSLSLAHMTNGFYDPTIGPLVNLWGFGPNGKRKVPSEKAILNVKKHVGHTKIKINEQDLSIIKSDPKVYLDLSSSAKGFAVDKVLGLINDKGYKNVMVEIGGELRVSGLKGKGNRWILAIESPENGGGQKIVKLKNTAMATSGNYRNFFKEDGKHYGHTISHESGKPVENNLASVTVLSKAGCMEADALATAFMSMGFERSLNFSKKHKIAAYFIYKEEDKLVSKSTALFNAYTKGK